MGTKWKMPLAVVGKPTGDGRQFDEGALAHRSLPLPLRYVASDSGGHQNAVIVGHISQIGKEKDGMLPGKGEFYDDDTWPDEVRNAATAAKKFTENKVIGPSVDLDQQEVEHVPEPKAYAAWKKEQIGKVKAAKMAHAGKTGGDCGCGDSPVMAEEAYDGPRLRMIRSGRMASATLVHIPAFAELSGHAKLTPVRDATDALAADAAEKLDWFSDVEWSDKIENEEEAALEMVASLVAGASPAAPPKAWFDDPKLDKATPLQIGDDGRVFGHVATWGTCHVGIGNSCTVPPKSLASYAYFHTGEVKTDDGSRVAVGRLTYGAGGHAGPNLGYRAAAEHYDNANTAGAVVRAGEDEHGIWVAGALVPEADDAAVRVMRSTPLSGDWRRIGGNLEMMAALHVNTAGFPIPRTMVASAITGMEEDEEVLSLVAAGVVGHQHAPAAAAPLDTEALGRAIARGMLAEQTEAAARTAREAEWAELLASATAVGQQADYDEAMSGLLVALVE